MKNILLTGVFLLTVLSASAQNLLMDGSFESITTPEINRIASIYGDYGKTTQTANPKMDAIAVERGKWYRRSSNSGYIHGAVKSDDYQEGGQALNLLISANCSNTGLENWDANALVQYVEVDKEKQYVLKFYAKNLNNCSKVYAGLVTGGDIPLKGTSWLDISNVWEEYTIEVNPAQTGDENAFTTANLRTSALVISNNTTYNPDTNKGLVSSVLIDDVRLYIKGTEPGAGENPSDKQDILTDGGFETRETGTDVVITSDAFGSASVGKWSLAIKGTSKGSGVITDEEKHSGNQSLKIELEEISARYHFFALQEVQNVTPADYTFVMWMKASKAGVPFRIDVIGVGDVDLVKSAQVTSTEWTPYEVKADLSAKSPTEVSTLRFSIRFNCTSSGNVDKTQIPMTFYLDDASCKGVIPDVVLFTPEPYLQSKTKDGILVNWLSAVGEEGVPIVEYGTTDLNQSATGNTKSVGSLCWSGVRLTGLNPDTEYQYRCRIGDNVSAIYKFRTLPADNTQRIIRYLSFGDSHEGSSVTPVRERTLALLKEKYGEDLHNYFDFIACTGDIIYNYGQYENEFTASHFTPNKEFTHALPMNISAGNHDFEKNDSQHSYFYDFMDFTELSDAEGDAKGKYYAQRIGDALFIYLNTNRQYLCSENNANQTYQKQTEAQMDWLKGKLIAAEQDETIDMIFLFSHHSYRYEMWSDPNDNSTREEIPSRLWPVLENSTKIKMHTYGHSHAMEQGILSLKNNSNISLFMNGNGGSYPCYFGKYGINQDFPEIYRNSESVGFAIVEIDPVNKTYNSKYYIVSQRRPVNGAASTTYIRQYDPAECLVEWGSDCKASAPLAPSVSSTEYDVTAGTFSLKASSAHDMMSAQYSIMNSATQEVVKDTVVHSMNVFGVTGYYEEDGGIDLTKSYLPVDLNADLDLSIYSVALPVGNYQAKVRYLDHNLRWSDYSSVSTGIVNNTPDDSDIAIFGGQGEVVIVSEGGNAEIYLLNGALVYKATIAAGERRISVPANSSLLVRLTNDNVSVVRKVQSR